MSRSLSMNPPRSVLIAELKRLHDTDPSGFTRMVANLRERSRRLGEHYHAPEFRACLNCGSEFEIQSNGAGRNADLTTPLCKRCGHVNKET